MPNLDAIKAELGLMRHRWQLMKPTSEFEKYRRECEENVLLLQLEAENLRLSFRREILLTKKVYIEKESKTIVRTAFNWESVREIYIAAINEKELNGLAYYQKEILKSYEAEQQSQPSNEQSGTEQGAVPATN